MTPSATAEELRQAFRALSKRYHPDTTTLPASQAAACFQAVQQAYAVLADPERRRGYDDDLQAAARLRAALASTSPRPLATPARSRPVATSLRRDLSGGEWLALLLLAVAMVLSLVLGVGLAWARGAALIRTPSWWSAPLAAQTGERPSVPSLGGRAPSPANTAVSPSPAQPGSLAGGAGGPAGPSPFPPLDPGAAGLERGDRAPSG